MEMKVIQKFPSLSCLTFYLITAAGPALSLDIKPPAASPAALAMAILNSTKSARKVSSDTQVPLVIFSQPVPAPITSQSRPATPTLPPTADQPARPGVLQTETVLETNLLSTDVTSLPGGNDQSVSMVTDRGDKPTPAATPVSFSNIWPLLMTSCFNVLI